MASKQRWSSTLGAIDVYTMMDAMEQMLGIEVELQLTLRNSHGMRGPWIVATAYTRPAAGVERAPLASVQFKAPSTEFSSLDPAVFRALHTLDGALVDRELEKREHKKAQLPPH